MTATAAAVLALGLGLANLRQLTSELGRIWLIGGAAWFFFLRAGPLAERLASGPAAGASFLRYAWPLLSSWVSWPPRWSSRATWARC